MVLVFVSHSARNPLNRETKSECMKAWSYKKNRAGSKKSKAYLSPKTLARHKRRIAKRIRKLEATNRLKCQSIEQLKQRLQSLEAKVEKHGDWHELRRCEVTFSSKKYELPHKLRLKARKVAVFLAYVEFFS